MPGGVVVYYCCVVFGVGMTGIAQEDFLEGWDSV